METGQATSLLKSIAKLSAFTERRIVSKVVHKVLGQGLARADASDTSSHTSINPRHLSLTITQSSVHQIRYGHYHQQL